MMQKMRKCAIFLMLPLHLVLFFAVSGSAGIFLAAVLCATLADLVLSIWQLRLLTRREASVKPFFRDFACYLAQLVLLIAAEFAVSRFIRFPGDTFNLFGSAFAQKIWLAICIAMLLTAALICMAVGIARTVLFHDDKSK